MRIESKPSGIWATENWFPHLPRWIFFGLAGPIFLGLIVFQLTKLDNNICVDPGSASAWEPSIVDVLAYFALCLLAIGRTHDTGQEFPLLRYLRTCGLVFGANDALIVASLFGLSFAFLLPSIILALLPALVCEGWAISFRSLWLLVVCGLYAPMIYYPFRFLALPTMRQPLSPTLTGAPK